ncbi:MAG: hypothetical protein IJ111_13810 [Eggerthellaceae bacterium]|nr:hypothetical protein [Eggerthellaceae bacterium]
MTDSIIMERVADAAADCLKGTRVGAPQPGKVAFARIGGGPASPGMDGCALEPTETSPSRPAWRAIIVASVKAGSLLCQTLILGRALDSPNPDKLNSHETKHRLLPLTSYC